MEFIDFNLTLELSNYQFRLLYFLWYRAGDSRQVKLSTEELAEMTGKANEKTVRSALKVLDAKGFIRREATKRANGYRGKDVIHLLEFNTPNTTITPDFKRPASRLREWTEMEALELYGTVCHLCNGPISLSAPRRVGSEGWEEGLHFDHVIPLVEGGLDTIDNVRPAHAICNLRKGRSTTKNARTDNGKKFRTSHDYVTNSYLSHPANMPLVPNSHINQDSYKLKDIENTKRVFTKEIVVPMKQYDDGEDLAGFGLVEPKDPPAVKVRKTDPKTRGKRPQHEWTPMDVAAEFSYQVGRKYPLLPGTVNVAKLSGALRKFRTQYQTTALIELELLRLFMADERNFKDIGDEAPHLYKMYLASFGKKMNQARENLGLNKITAKLDTAPTSGTLKASDGRVFQNTMSGRTQLERHEKRLKDNK